MKETTGLDLCPNAVVRNVKTPAKNNPGMGFIYIVDVRMSPACVDRVKRQLRERQADPKSDLPPKGRESLRIGDIEGGVRITYIG